MTLEYPWYAVVEGDDLEQGDFLNDCEVLVPNYIPLDSAESSSSYQLTYQASAVAETYDVVIVSQSCDLENGKLDYVLMCPRWSYKEYAEFNDDFKKIDKLEQVRQAKQHRFFMLNSCDFDELSHEIQIVDLGIVFSIPYGVMKQIAKTSGKRLRLLSPYKEKLAQSFAYYYMRVALPIDIPKFEKAKVSAIARVKSGRIDTVGESF